MAKISIILHDLRGGGAEKMMVRLANQLAIMGDQVELVLLTSGGVNKAFLSQNVTLVELYAKRTLEAFKPLRKYLKQTKPDGILAALTHVNVITAFVCMSLGYMSRLSVSERNTFSLDKTVNSNRIMKIVYVIAPYIYRSLPNAVIAVSQGVADDLVECSITRESDVVIASNPVITEQTISASNQPAMHPWLVDKKTKTIVAVGRLSHQKGFDMLIDAFFQVSNQLVNNIDVRLVIFGEGDLKGEFEKQIERLSLEHKVSLAGYTDNPLAEIKAADLFVLSSRFEGSPNVLVEAMSVGTAVVAFDCPHGPKEILENGSIAPLVEDKNVQSLAESIIDALLNERSEQKKQMQLKAIERFSSLNSATRYRSLILPRDN